MDYKKAYTTLFNEMTDAIERIEKTTVITQEIEEGLAILKKAQQVTEEMFIEEE